MPRPDPISVALVDDYDVVLAGLAGMLAPYSDRVRIVEMDANEPLEAPVDVALLDSFAQSDWATQVAALVRSGRACHVVVYTWTFHPEQVENARRIGAHGYLSKTATAAELVGAIEAVCAGEVVVDRPPTARAHPTTGGNWPGRTEGLTDREAEILALMAQGKSNAEVAGATFLSPNTVKSYIRTLYRKIGVNSRTQAVLWGVRHGFTPDHDRIAPLRSGS